MLSDQMLIELGAQVIADEEYDGHDWEGIALVIQIEPRQRLFGYMYLPGGDWTVACPALDGVLDKALALAEAMRADGRGAWKACLLRISRAGMRLAVEFEAEDPARWNITPGNLSQRVEELRPLIP